MGEKDPLPFWAQPHRGKVGEVWREGCILAEKLFLTAVEFYQEEVENSFSPCWNEICEKVSFSPCRKKAYVRGTEERRNALWTQYGSQN